jgi:hypothetical protein
MRTWTRAPRVRRCGRCGTDVAVGAPYLSIRLAGTGRELVRCATCEGPAPPDLPALIEPRSAHEPINLTRFGILPMDFSRRPRQDR